MLRYSVCFELMLCNDWIVLHNVEVMLCNNGVFFAMCPTPMLLQEGRSSYHRYRVIPLSQSSELIEWVHGHSAHPHQSLPGEEEDYVERGAQVRCSPFSAVDWESIPVTVCL